jgi:cysteine desulfurase/selenocysteine lyase
LASASWAEQARATAEKTFTSLPALTGQEEDWRFTPPTGERSAQLSFIGLDVMTTSTTIERIRDDFPLLSRDVDGRPLVYLDSAATSQKPGAVLDAMDAFYRQTNANVRRGVYSLAADADRRFEAGRASIARLVNAPLDGLVATKNVTEAINLVAWAWGVRTLRPGDEVVVSIMEHHSNIVPWQLVATITGATVQFCPITPDGELDLDALRGLIGGRTRLVSIVHVSNALGTINPVREIADLAHAAGALMMVDGAQSVPHMPVDFAELGCDFLAFTGHKMLGPTGVGMLVARPELLDEIEPFMGGGEMIDDVTTEGSTWAEGPRKFEAGTPPIAEVIGLGAAAEYLMDIGMDHVRAHELALTDYALNALKELEGIRVFGPRAPERRGCPISFELPDVHAHDVAQFLDQEGVCVRAGHHCTKPLMRALGVTATARASTHVYSRFEDIDALVRGLHGARAYFA